MKTLGLLNEMDVDDIRTIKDPVEAREAAIKQMNASEAQLVKIGGGSATLYLEMKR